MQIQWNQDSKVRSVPAVGPSAGPSSRVSELMHRGRPFASPDRSVKEAVVVMAKQDVDGIAVVDSERRLIGIVSQQSIAIRASLGDKPVQALLVRDAMIKDTTCLSVTDTLSDALHRMIRRKARWLPVVARDGRVVGVLELSDIVSRAASPRDARGAWLEVYRSGARSA